MKANSPNPVDGDVQALNVRGRFTSERFLPECLKPEEISGEKQRARIEELMMWFDRYYLASANPKWLRGHVAELCYYIMAKSEATPPAQLLRPVEMPDEAPNALIALCQQVYDSRITGASVAQDVWQDCLDELRQQGIEVKS